MSEFVRFPRTPHVAWLGAHGPRDDKVMPVSDVRELLAHNIVVEEKLDGANIGVSVGSDQQIRVQNRGQYLRWDSLHPQFKPLRRWISERQSVLVDALRTELILFGEWCYAQHSIRYTRLPDWFVAFDVFDRTSGRFWSTPRRIALFGDLHLSAVPQLADGRFDAQGIKRLLGRSQFGDEPAEGLYVRRDSRDWLEQRAKLVRAEFTQAISTHWTLAAIRPNQVVHSAGYPHPSHSRI